MVALCGMSVIMGANSLLVSYFYTGFSKYGKNGAAAGLSNSASSFGVVLESYGFLYIAEKYGWNLVTASWTVMIAIALVLTAVTIPLYNKFKREM